MKTNEAIAGSQKAALESKAAQLTEAIFAAKSPAVKKLYETQLEKVAQDLESSELVSVEDFDFSIPYRTALAKSKAMLKSPLKYWESVDVREQHRLFYFLFEEKLPYDMKTGYRTEKIPTATTLFEQFVAVGSTDVEVGRIELPSENVRLK